jgi:hypothetical protein
MSAVNFITSLARKLLARESKGITTIPNRMAVEQKAGEIAATLQSAGLPLNRADDFIKSEQDLVRILNLIESTPPVMREVPSGIRSTKSAKIMDMEGKEIDPRSKIMGGKQSETEAEIAERLGRENKETVSKIKNRKMVDDAIDNMSPSLSGDTRTDAELVAEDLAERMGLVYDDLPTKQRLDLYDQAYTALSKQRFKGMKKPKDDPEDMAQGGRAGFFMGGPNPKGLGTLRAILNYMSKKGKETGGFKGADLSGLDMLRLSNPKALNKMLEDVRGKVNIREGIMGTDTVRAQQQALREKRKGLTEKSLDVARAMKEEQDKIAKRIEREAEKTIIPKVKKQLMEGMGMSEEVAEKAARDMAEAAQNIKLMDSPPEITDEGLLQLENVLKNLETGGKKKRDLNADGGRIGFKDGMTRRTFLKIFGGLVSLPIVGKVLAPLKLTRGVSKVPIIKTDNVPGKPEWFDQLVNKVIIEGDDVTKKFATGERQSIHQKTLDDGSVVRVTEDVDDGAVRVEYESEANTFADTVQLQYKKPLPDEGDPRPAAEFTTSESGPVGRQYGPDDFEIEVDEVGGRSIGDLDSDVSKLKEYATGKKLTMKEIVEAKRRRDKALAISENIDEAQLNAVMLRQGDADDSYFGDPDDFASGGIARMLGE